jgi:hypothetical protein
MPEKVVRGTNGTAGDARSRESDGGSGRARLERLRSVECRAGIGEKGRPDG